MTSSTESRIRTSTVMVLAMRGVLAVVLALSTVALLVLGGLFPRVTAGVLALLFGVYVLLDGALALGSSVRTPKPYRPWLVVHGAIGLGAGAVVLGGLVVLGPGLLRLIALWAILTGVLELIVSREVRRQHGTRVLVVSGVLSLLFGAVTLIAWPGAGLIPFMWVLAAYGLLAGFVRIVAAAR